MDTVPPSPTSRLPPAGRDRELAAARDLLAAAVAGRGSLLLIAGEAGVGKTAVVEAIAREAEAAGARVLLGSCYDRAETPPYGPWIECLAPCGETGREDWSSLPAPPDPTAAPNQDAFFAQARGFFAAVAAARPLLVVLEDLHWADVASLHLLRSLARAPSLAPLPLLLVATYRDEEVRRGHPLAEEIPLLVREAPVERIDLLPLDAAAAAALVRARYGLTDPDAERLTAYLIQRTEGNALFMTELLRTLEEECVLAREDGSWRLGTVAHAPVPPLLRQVIEARTMRLGEAAYELLAVAAVIGQEVPLAVWQEVARADEDDLVELAERAEAAHLVVAWAGGDGLRFAHALVREALYEGAARRPAAGMERLAQPAAGPRIRGGGRAARGVLARLGVRSARQGTTPMPAAARRRSRRRGAGRGRSPRAGFWAPAPR